MATAYVGTLRAVKYDDAGMRYKDRKGLPWTANPLVLRHGCRITSARIVASHTTYSPFVTELAADICLPCLKSIASTRKASE